MCGNVFEDRLGQEGARWPRKESLPSECGCWVSSCPQETAVVVVRWVVSGWKGHWALGGVYSEERRRSPQV